MELVATTAETEPLLAQHPDDPELLTHFLRQRLIEVVQGFLESACADSTRPITCGMTSPARFTVTRSPA